MSNCPSMLDEENLSEVVGALCHQVQTGLHEPTAPHGKITPDRRLVDALITTGTHSYLTYRAESYNTQSPWELLGAFARNPDSFFPPKELCPENFRTSNALGFWRKWASYVLWQAQQKAFGQNQATGGYVYTDVFRSALSDFLKKSRALKSIYLSTTLGNRADERVWCAVDTDQSKGISEDEASREFKEFVDLARTHLRRGIEMILSDPEINAQILKTVRVWMTIELEVCLRDQVARLEAIRNEVESPEERQKFMFLVKQLAAVLGCDVNRATVEFLSARDALFHGAQALYKAPQTPDERATLAIPMSHYGTNRMLSLAEICHLVAHEAAHHQLEMANQRGPVHGIDHGVLEAAMSARLKRCRIFTDSHGFPQVEIPPDILDPDSKQARPVIDGILKTTLSHSEAHALNPETGKTYF